jgi:hypothetical protein
MGSLAAADFADQVNEGNIQLRTAISWHLTSNHYPPLPAFFVPVALAAIEAGQDEDWDLEIDLPLGCEDHTVILTEDNADEHKNCEQAHVVQWRGRSDGKVRAGDVIESFHLDSFL